MQTFNSQQLLRNIEEDNYQNNFYQHFSPELNENSHILDLQLKNDIIFDKKQKNGQIGNQQFHTPKTPKRSKCLKANSSELIFNSFQENNLFFEITPENYFEDNKRNQIHFWEFILTESSTNKQIIQSVLKKILSQHIKSEAIKQLIYLALNKCKQQSNLSEIYNWRNPKDRQQDQNNLRILIKKQFSQKYLDNKGENQALVQKFQDILTDFEINDYSFLYKLQDMLEQFIGRVLQYWDLLKPIFQKNFQTFLDLMKMKIQFVSESRCIYPALYRIQRRLQLTLNYKGSRKKLNNLDDHLTDLLFQHYMQELQTKSSRNGVYYVRNPKTDQRIPLSEFIATCKEFFQINSSWKQIFSVVTQKLNEQDVNYDNKRSEVMRLYISNLPNATFPNQSCLGCSEYFYVSQNIYHPEICKHVLALLDSASQMTSNASNIKDEVCSMLNAKGGVLLFDCSKTNNQVIPRGSYFIEKEKEQIEQKITDYLEGIYPKPQVNKNIFISWVPMVEDPFDYQKAPNLIQSSLAYIEGLYVARIVVKPSFGHMTYYWTQDEKPIFSVRTGSLFPSSKKMIAGRNISRFIRQKFNHFLEQFKELDQIERKIIGSEVCTINHRCKAPDKGIQMFEKKIDINSNPVNPEQTYKYASVVVAKKQDHQTIIKNLLRYNIQCVIVTPFQGLKLKGAAHSAILYHNTRFDELLAVVSNNKQFEFGGRYLLVILITEYIRLTERSQHNVMSEADFSSLAVWLNKQYPKETLKMWRFITDSNEEEYYVETESKESSLYIYIVMTQFLERSSFKNPKGLERMGERERASRFKQCFQIIR